MILDRSGLREAVQFWETGRLGYNGLLGAVVFAVAIAGDAWKEIAREWIAIVILGVIANALYCFAYLLEFLARAAGMHAPWRMARPWIWAMGAGFAALLALFVLAGVSGFGAGPL